MLAFACLISGCATVLPPTQVKLSTARGSSPQVVLVDARANDKRVYREESAGATYKFFGDEVFDPTLFEVVRNALSSREDPNGAPVHALLLRADVGYHVADSTAFSSGAGYPYIPPGVGVGPAVLGSLIGLGIVAAVKRAAANEYAVAYFTVRVNGQDVTGNAMESIDKNTGSAEALKIATDRAMTRLTELFRLAADPEVPPE